MLLLQGLGTSPGIAKGKVRIISSENDYSKVGKGDIVVTRITDPSMTTILNKCSAIICDIGGLTSHPSIIAREMGIPAVVGTKTATTRLSDGEEIVVDGARGEVHSADEELTAAPVKKGTSSPAVSDDWVEASISAFVKGQASMDPKSWAPPNVWLLEPLFADLWINKMLQVSQHISPEVAAQTLPGPSGLRKEFRWALWNMKLMGWNAEKRMELLDFYRNILEEKTSEDIFGNHSTYWHSEEEIKEIISSTTWHRPDETQKQLIGKLSANTPPLLWGLYTDFYYNFAYEMLGLYKGLAKMSEQFSERDSLMIRSYGPFNAPELWAHSAKFPINKITIACVYEDLEGEFDFINHFVTHQNIMEKLKFFSLFVDGKEITDAIEIEEVNKQIIAMALEQDGHVKAIDLEQEKEHAVKAKYYAFKDLFERAGLAWEPEQEVLERVQNKELLSIDFSQLDSDEKIRNFWTEVFNPVKDFEDATLKAAATEIQRRVN